MPRFVVKLYFKNSVPRSSSAECKLKESLWSWSTLVEGGKDPTAKSVSCSVFEDQSFLTVYVPDLSLIYQEALPLSTKVFVLRLANDQFQCTFSVQVKLVRAQTLNRQMLFKLYIFLKMGQSRPLFVYFHLFYMTQIKYKSIKAYMVCLGLEPGAAEWQAQINPLSYGGTPKIIHFAFSERIWPRQSAAVFFSM